MVLSRFSDATRSWFEGAFEQPTAAQTGAWTAVSGGEHALVVAPTGSGKTLADVGDVALGLATTAAGLGIAIALVDGVTADSPVGILVVALAVSVGDLLLRAPLRWFAAVADRDRERDDDDPER